jgi:hypothetical protein
MLQNNTCKGPFTCTCRCTLTGRHQQSLRQAPARLRQYYKMGDDNGYTEAIRRKGRQAGG